MKKIGFTFGAVFLMAGVALAIYWVVDNRSRPQSDPEEAGSTPPELTITKKVEAILTLGDRSWQYTAIENDQCSEQLFSDPSKFSEAESQEPPIYDKTKYCLRFVEKNGAWKYSILNAQQPAFSIQQSTEDTLEIVSPNKTLKYEYRPLQAPTTCRSTAFDEDNPLPAQAGEKIQIDEAAYNTDYCFRSLDEFHFYSYLNYRVKYPTFLSVPSFRLLQKESEVVVAPRQNKSLTDLRDWQYVQSETYLGCWGHLFEDMTAKSGQSLKLTDASFEQHYCFRAYNSKSKQFEYEYIFVNRGLNFKKDDGSTIAISPEIVNLAERMQLTDLGKDVFYAANPLIYSDIAAFEKCCGEGNGFYDGQRIHLRGSTIPKIRAGHTSSYGWYESVAAHELMHAVLLAEGLPKLRVLIEPHYDFKEVFVDHYTFGHLYEEYEFWEVISEVHSVIVQKAVDLPPELDDHYNRYFKNRHLIRNFDALSGFSDPLPAPQPTKPTANT